MMTNPITLPLELVHQWVDMLASRSDHAVFTMAAQWGADQELEACCEWVESEIGRKEWAAELRTARRLPSLKEQALAVLDDCADGLDGAHENVLRRALEALDE